MKVSDEVKAVLRRVEIEGDLVRLPDQLDRKLYVEVNKVLVALGGKWHRGKAAHVFPVRPDQALTEVLDASAVTTAQDVGFFPTPAPVIERMLELAEVHPDHLVLEPSAGQGAIVLALIVAGVPVSHITAVEIVDGMARGVAQTFGVEVITGDFLEKATIMGSPYDRIVMNPPFAKGAAVDHVTAAISLLKPGGRLVAVLPSGAADRTDRKHLAFRELVGCLGGVYENLPDGAFKTSGTSVRSVLVTLEVQGRAEDVALPGMAVGS
jgi:protein-L-isoaspartate O-methyltransferase